MSDAIQAGRGRGELRGEGRGRGEVRGRGRGRVQAIPEDPLQQVRAQRALTKRRVSALPASTQKDLMVREREVQPERMLLPDAPPRRRQKKGGSPVRAACVFAELSGSSFGHIAGPSQARPNFNYPDYEHVADDWLGALTDDEDDDIYDIMTELSHHETGNLASACNVELTDTQANILQAEDQKDDQVLRDLVTDDDCYRFDWNRDRQTFRGQQETFNETSGPAFDVTVSTRPIDVYDRMIDVDFLDLLCTETNRYAEQKIALLRQQNRLSAHSRLTRWTPTDRDEMVSFLTVQVLQGLYLSTEEEAYFKFNGYGTMPYFAKIMSYNRFLLLKMMMHFVDNENMPDKTRLGEIQPIIDYFNDKFSSLYMPGKEVVIDESLLKWHGRLSFVQKIATKAAQIGVKTYELCESATGYLWRFFVYAGKKGATGKITSGGMIIDGPDGDGPDGDRPDDDGPATDNRTTRSSFDRPTNATSKIVYDLFEPLLDRGHTLIMDNFYNSPLLLRCLKRQKTDCFGTLRLNREFVPDSIKTLTKTDMRQGEVVATYCSDLSILVWRDANLVSLISTYHNLEIGNIERYNKVTYKPKIVLDYNRHMGGVDRKDQFLSAQPIERQRNKVWYKKLFRHLYNSAIFNCYVIFASAHNITHRKFRITLAEQLLLRHKHIDLTAEPRRINVRSSTTGDNMTLRIRQKHMTHDRPNLAHNHFPMPTSSRYKTCRVCPKRKRTSYKCEECDVPLCIKNCFKAYHKH